VHVSLAKYAIAAAACYPPSREVVEQLFEADDDHSFIDEELRFHRVDLLRADFQSVLVYYAIFSLFWPPVFGWIHSI
jgi:hypothetical protein